MDIEDIIEIEDLTNLNNEELLEVDNKASNIDVKKKQAPRKAVNFVIKLAVPLAVIKPPPEPPEPPIPSPPPSLF